MKPDTVPDSQRAGVVRGVRVTRAIVLALLLAPLASSQESPDFRYRGNGHAYFSTGACQHGYAHLGAGGGGEAFVWRGLALGGEAGFLVFNDNDKKPIGLFATHAGYHFVDRNRPVKVDPFVNVAWMGVAAGGSDWRTNLYGGIGGGVNYWRKPRWGIRMEGRVNSIAGSEVLIIARIGLVFR